MIPFRTPYQRIAERLDIRAAIRAASARNDLLPPRREDKAGGELGKRFSEYLVRELETGRYDPTPAHIIAVPKSQIGTRPAALLPFQDRVVYEAIVDVLRLRVARSLLGEDIVFWPRANGASDKNWSTFERAILEQNGQYVVSCDIAGFYESIDHSQLASAVVGATGYRDIADALVHFLDRTMNGNRGLPQGLEASDTLATIYLAQVDRAMIRNGFRYIRHGDDARISVDSYSHGCRAARVMEAELRKCGLLLNGSKTRVFKRRTYEESLVVYEKEWAKAKKSFVEEAAAQLREDDEALEEALARFDLEELGWALFYHGIISVEEVIDKLKAKMTLEDGAIAARLFNSIMEKRPTERNGKVSRLEREMFHWQLKKVLYALAAAESDVALSSVGELIRRYPDKTEILCEYMMRLRDRDEAIVSQIEGALDEDTMEWAFAWMMRVLSKRPGFVTSGIESRLERVAGNPGDSWLAAVEAAKCLAAIGKLGRETLLLLWNTCPHAFRIDLAVAAVRMEKVADWGTAFVQSARGERVQEVVMEHEAQGGIVG
ncbi:MAG: RNA-directed DNA polymerase [Gemmatimonadota bacterium]|nr:RNA-directed DNA polymerase [Gemmatimonadota bacterium]